MAKIKYWFRRGTARIPVFEKAKDVRNSRSLTQNHKTNVINEGKKIKDNISNLNDDKYPSGTYDLNTLKPVSYNSGYQASFFQTDDNYSDYEFGMKIREGLKLSSDNVVSAGKFGGTPEASFNFEKIEDAIAYAKKYNQMSIWDWKNGKEIQNPYYDDNKGNKIGGKK